MDPHGVPSAGDFAVARSAAVVMEGTVGVMVADCNITRVDGNGLIISGFNRNATVVGNTFSWVGDPQRTARRDTVVPIRFQSVQTVLLFRRHILDT